MALLIDGYNLLHASGIFGRGGGPRQFERSRQALLDFLAASLEAKERLQTTIVFDAADAPPGLPKIECQAEMTIRYSVDYPDADALIEQLIVEHHSPRSLLVVSSDHRIQRAARRRRSRFIDSDDWCRKLWQTRIQTRQLSKGSIPEKPIGKLSETEIDYWVQQFGLELSGEEGRSSEVQAGDGSQIGQQDWDNPFPPGYGDDLLQDGELPDI